MRKAILAGVLAALAIPAAPALAFTGTAPVAPSAPAAYQTALGSGVVAGIEASRNTANAVGMIVIAMNAVVDAMTTTVTTAMAVTGTRSA